MAICVKCDQNNAADASFCAWCGTPLVPVVDSNSIPHRDLGQIVSHSIELFSKNFWKFILLSLPVQLIGLVGLLFVPEAPLELYSGGSSDVPRDEFDQYFVAMALVIAPLAFVMGLATMIANGASIHALGKTYLGRQISVKGSYRVAVGKALILIISGLLATLGTMLASPLVVLLIGVPLMFFLAISWAFVFPLIMIEGAGPISALKGSWNLVSGSRWRILGIGVVFLLINLGVAGAVGMATGIVSSFSGLLSTMIPLVGQTVLAPLNIIGLTVVYFDLRSRKEGLTLDSLAMEMGEAVVGAASSDDLRDM